MNERKVYGATKLLNVINLIHRVSIDTSTSGRFKQRFAVSAPRCVLRVVTTVQW